MATTNHVTVPDIGVPSTSGVNSSRAWWGLTRALKKAGWKYKASSNGTTYEFSGDPALDKWGSGVTSNAGGASAVIATPSVGRATITGLTGIVAADKGRFLLISGSGTAANNHQHQIEEILSSTSVRIDARQFAVAADAGPLTWSILDTMPEAWYGGIGATLDPVVAWWCGQGPSVLKIPITAASAGTFKRGENITQASTGAQGELVGYTYYNATGWLVVMPRVRGTGTGVHGWQTGFVITGDKSLATVTHNGTAIDFVYEIVIAKAATATTHVVLLTQADTVAESAQLFSVQAAGAGCTATVHPGGAASGANLLGSKAWVQLGSSALPGGALGSAPIANIVLFNAIALVADAIPEANYSADGSYTLLFFNNYVTPVHAPGSVTYGLQRLDDTEDGEIAIYAMFTPHYTVFSRTAFTPNSTAESYADSSSWEFIVNAIGSARCQSWLRRGMTTEAFTAQNLAVLHAIQTQGGNFEQLNPPTSYQTTYHVPMMLAATANPRTRQMVKLWVTTPSPPRILRGSLRWMRGGHGNAIGSYHKVGDRGFLQGSSGKTNINNVVTLQGCGESGPSLFFGPYDGAPITIYASV